MTARDRTILMIVAALAALAAFWFLAIKPKRAEIGSLNGQIATQSQRLQTAEGTVASGVAAKAAYPRNYATVAQLGKAVPADDDIPSMLYQLDAASHGAHVDFKSITRATGGSSGTSPSTGSSATGSSATGSSATGSSATGAAALPPGATVGTAGLATLPFSFTFSGSFFDLQRFIAQVQGFVRSSDTGVAVRGRLLTINGVSLVPGSKGLSNLEAKISATAYLTPPTDQSGTAAAPSSSSTGSATGTGSGTTAAAPPNTSSAIAGGTN